MIMKFKIIFPAIIILFFSCSNPDENTASRIDSLTSLPIPLDTVGQNLGKNDTAISPFLKSDANTLTQSDSNKTETTNRISGGIMEGIVYYTLPYCGGARPTEEILADKNKLRLLTNSTLRLKGKSEYLVTTNGKGIFKSGIPAGTYEVYLTDKTDKTIYDVDPANCENCLTQKMGTITLQKGIQASIKVHFNCGPNDHMRP